MEKWPDEPYATKAHIEELDDDVVGVLDTLTTTAYMGFYFLQELNGHLGSREEGREYQRDIGGAQSQLRRLLEFISSSSVKCNFIINPPHPPHRHHAGLLENCCPRRGPSAR